MRYWMALVYLRNTLAVNHPQNLSLESITDALACSKRNAQLVIKKLSEQNIIDWQPSVGRGNLPIITLLKDVRQTIDAEATHLLQKGKIELAMKLVEKGKQEQFLANYLAVPTAKPLSKHILRVPFYRGTHCLDPISIARRTEQHIANHLYAKLIRFDSETAMYTGDLALNWSESSGGVHVTLRKGITFHDGSRISSADIKVHYERLMNSKNHNAKLYSCISKIEVKDEYRISFYSSFSSSFIKKLLSFDPMGITKYENEKLLGSGPFYLAEQTEWRTYLKVYESYHGWRPWVDGVEIWNIGDKAKDFLLNSDVVHGREVTANMDKMFHQRQQWEKGSVYLLLNQKHNSWLAVRENSKAIMTLISSLGLPAMLDNSGICQANGMLKRECSDVDAYRHSEVKNLIPPLNTTLKIVTYQLSDNICFAEHVQSGLQQHGINSELEVVEFPVFNRPETIANADIVISGEVFNEDLEMAWMEWLFANNSLENCMTNRHRNLIWQQTKNVLNLATLKEKLCAFEELEQSLIEQYVYQPIFHIKQNLSFAESISSSQMLANGWIDFNTVTIRSSSTLP
ncbi:ABC transporter substrate-binding protein [Vibrio marisflavi]|uniref:HTH-type transcriptional regulator SgrR n=1 Tax=Vibrio marisflavi CECT 7928 TaxID=634439 RepID=A0ABM9A2Z4_9VIBR|nr:ABC transporter substrate-binding protein [Vibrio marisflavi]CAH0537775.1 HTH-type transcriptional regulator SgrR [Vibrio marisflavi CECT 7928]